MTTQRDARDRSRLRETANLNLLRKNGLVDLRELAGLYENHPKMTSDQKAAGSSPAGYGFDSRRPLQF